MSETAISKRGRANSVEAERKKEMYLIWRAMPAMLRILPQADLVKMGYDVDDPLFKKLIEIKNQSQFCALVGVSLNQPARWLADEDFQKQVERVSVHDHVMRFEKDVDFTFTQKVIRHGDAGRVKLWKQLYKGWTEKTEHLNTNRNLNMVELVREIEKRNAAIRNAAKERPEPLSPTEDEDILQE